jgi:hypothetical protein
MEEKFRKSEARTMNLYRKLKFSEIGKRRSEISDRSKGEQHQASEDEKSDRSKESFYNFTFKN